MLYLPTQYGITPLHEAAGCGSNNVIDALIGWGAPVNAVDVVSCNSKPFTTTVVTAV